MDANVAERYAESLYQLALEDHCARRLSSRHETS